MRARIALAALFAFLLVSRLCHAGVLWVEECYPAAAAIQILHGKALYGGIWFDKPPLLPWLYLLWGGFAGWPLRVAGSVILFGACWFAYRFALEMWSEREGIAAAWLLGWFLTFGVPAAVMALAPDLFTVLPHAAAAFLAWRGRAFLAGCAAGCALLANPKGLLVLVVCVVWRWRALPRLAAGFVLPNALAALWLWNTGALSDYWQQVWTFGRIYTNDSPFAHPGREALSRTVAWMGFQSALVAGAAAALRRAEHRWKWLLWIALAAAGVTAGLRFFPRYYFLLLPPLVLLAARSFATMRRVRLVMLVLLLAPLVRFGPRYVLLGTGADPQWSDLALGRDSDDAARMVTAHARAGDTLLVWGYRPEIWVRTRMPAGTRFLDSQMLTGVFADRHLLSTEASFPGAAKAHRAELALMRPTVIVDGLGPLNPALAITNYPDLRAWLEAYQEVGRTRASVVYRLAPLRRAAGADDRMGFR